MRLSHIRNLDVETALASGESFLSAASGLVRVDDLLCVVADDDLHLACFQGDAPGTLIRLLAGELPRDAKARKKVKPDFEILIALGANRLLAMGSGSTDRRMRAVIIGEMHVTPIGLTPLFAAIAPLVPEINLEGALVDGDRLLLFNRGNIAAPATHIIETSLSAVLAGGAGDVRLIRTLPLPELQGVPLTVTDACTLDDGHILLSVVAEATDNSYADGALAGAAFVLMNAAFDVVAINTIDPPVKVEGIAAQRTPDGIDILCVTDADDPDQPAGLYGALWQI
jgi:hypothetical protein